MLCLPRDSEHETPERRFHQTTFGTLDSAFEFAFKLLDEGHGVYGLFVWFPGSWHESVVDSANVIPPLRMLS